MAGCEGARENAGVGERDQRDTGRRPDQFGHVTPVDAAERGQGHSFRQCTDHPDVIGETECGRDDDRRDHRDEHTGDNGTQTRNAMMMASEPKPTAAASGIDVAVRDGLHGLPDLADQVVRVDGEAEQLG